jgi:hypothetical protein
MLCQLFLEAMCMYEREPLLSDAAACRISFRGRPMGLSAVTNRVVILV